MADFQNIASLIALGPRVPSIDFTGLGDLPKSYWEGLNQANVQQQRDVFKDGIPSDPGQLVAALAHVQGAGAAPAIMQYYKMLFGQQASNQEYAPSPNSPQPTSGAPPSANAAPSSPAVVGYPEGVKLGYYDPPTTPGGRPPMQPDAAALLPPNQRVAQGFNTAQEIAAPASFDQTLGGLVPAGRTPGQQVEFYSRKINSGMLEPEQIKNYQGKIDAINKALEQYRGGAIQNAELTQAEKNARASGQRNPLDYGANEELYKKDATDFQADFKGLQTAGRSAVSGIKNAQLLKQATLDPSFYSGPLNEYVTKYRQFQSIFGSNPSKAVPAEIFNKVASQMLTEQIRTLGQSGVGRVLMSEVNNMKQGIASLGITPQSNRALAELNLRVHQQAQGIANSTRNIPRVPGQMSQTLDQAVQGYLESHPLVSPAEAQHPELLGAPDVPPQATNWSEGQVRQWAQGLGLKPGDALRMGDQIVKVP